jgi:hypothetical protein
VAPSPMVSSSEVKGGENTVKFFESLLRKSI